MKRVALYVRVSTQEQRQHGLSVDNQITALEAFCKEKGYIIQGLYNDAGISARKSYKKRPALLELVEQCQEGNVDLVLFTKLDRFFRSVGDYYEVINKMNNVKWRAIWEDYETETSAGVFKVNIMLSVAQSEADRTSERIKAVMDYKRQRGEYVGALPFGYVRKDKKLYQNKDEADCVNKIFNRFAETSNTFKAFETALENGYPFTQRALRRMLKNPIYYTAAEPYLTKERFEELQKLFSTRNKMHYKTGNIYIFAGLLKCGICGCRLAGTPIKSSGKVYFHYFCLGDNRKIFHKTSLSVSELKVEKYLLEKLDDIVGDYNLSLQYKNAPQQNDAKAKKKSLLAKKERIGIRFEMGEISVEEYKRKIFEIQNEIDTLVISKPSAPLKLETNWKDIYNSLDRAHKARFWRGIIDYIKIYRRWEKPPEIHLKI